MLGRIIVLLSLCYVSAFAKVYTTLKSLPSRYYKVFFSKSSSFKLRSFGKKSYIEVKKGTKMDGYVIYSGDFAKDVKGYIDHIYTIIAIDTNYRVKGIKVVSHKEDIPEAKRLYDKHFLLQFKGKSYRNIRLGRGIDAITGATISTKALCKIVRLSIIRFVELMEEKSYIYKNKGKYKYVLKPKWGIDKADIGKIKLAIESKRLSKHKARYYVKIR